MTKHPQALKVVIADDEKPARSRVRDLLEDCASSFPIELVGEAASGRALLALLGKTPADVVLLDIRMPEMDGIEATRQLAGSDVDDPIAVVIITTFDLDDYVHGALKAGAHGFLLKDADTESVWLVVGGLLPCRRVPTRRRCLRRSRSGCRGRVRARAAEEACVALIVSTTTPITFQPNVARSSRTPSRCNDAVSPLSTLRADRSTTSS